MQMQWRSSGARTPQSQQGSSSSRCRHHCRHALIGRVPPHLGARQRRIVAAVTSGSDRAQQQRLAVAAPEQEALAAADEQQQQVEAEAESPVPVGGAPAADQAPAEPPPKLSNLQLQAIINTKGFVDPPGAPGTPAVFAVYDAHQRLQYIGFSRDLRPSLRTVLGRRPDKAYYYKVALLPSVDQDAMLAIRQAWFDECGAPPPGNKLALERKAWQTAVDAGAISARAKPAAAAEKARELQAALKARGCAEVFTPDPALMADGQVDFLATVSSGAAAASSEAAAAAGGAGADDPAAGGPSSGSESSSKRTATVVVDGQAKQFGVEYLLKYPTKGGFMVDVKLSFDHMDSDHRVIVGRSYYEPYGIPPEAPVEAALALLLSKKLPRRTEGMLGTAEFPVGYFTVSEMEQWFGEEFGAQFLHMTGHALKDGMDFFWRMNKIHDYGSKLEDPTSLGAALAAGGLGAM